jgi:uncharacterized membrane protein
LDQDFQERAWHDPENWTPGPFGFYFSKADTRLWVPKRTPALGWTLNMGHPAAGAWLFGIILASALIPTLIVVGVLIAAASDPALCRTMH